MVSPISGDMIGEQIVDASAELIAEIGQIGNWLQALGIVIIIGIISQLIIIWLNYKRTQEAKKTNEYITRLEKKIDRLMRKNN